LTATVYPTNATSKDVTWSSLNSTVATVSTSGVVTAAAVGTAVIMVTTVDGNKTDTCVVTVSAATTPPDTNVPVESISFSSPTQTVQVGGTLSLTLTFTPSNATDKSVTYTSNAPTVASVSSTGLVTGVSAGTAYITAVTPNGKNATCTITVTSTPAVDGIISRVIPPDTSRLAVGKAFNLEIGLTSVPAAVSVSITRPDGIPEQFTARMEGLTAWVTYTPQMQGLYTVYVTALNTAGAVVGTGVEFFTVTSGGSGGGGSGGGGGCNAGIGAALLILALAPALKRTKVK
jgi:Synergist-CTERM protein sorting domain-containing protein